MNIFDDANRRYENSRSDDDTRDDRNASEQSDFPFQSNATILCRARDKFTISSKWKSHLPSISAENARNEIKQKSLRIKCG